MATIAELVVKIGADAKELNKVMGDISKKIKKDFGNISSYASKAAIGMGIASAAIGGIGMSVMKTAESFEVMRTRLKMVTGSTEEASKQFEKLKKSLYAADEAAREFEKLKKREAALNLQLEGIQDYWRSGKQGQAASYILEALGRIFRDLKLSGTFKDKKGLFAK